MNPMKKIAALFLLPIAFLFAADLEAQTASSEFTLNVPSNLSISVDNATVSFPVLGSGDFGTAVNASNDVTVTHGGNQAYDVTFKANADNFVDGTATPTSKAVGDMEYDIASAGSWAALPNTAGPAATLVTGSTGTGNTTVTSWRVNVAANEAPGTYKATVVFTIAAN